MIHLHSEIVSRVANANFQMTHDPVELDKVFEE
jgi:hypothetical protein